MNDEILSDSPESAAGRWQAETRAQLSFAINLFVGLATASLGLAFGWFTSDRFQPTALGQVLFLVGAWSMLLSLFSGCGATVMRLLDFRKTAKIAKLRGESSATRQLTNLRKAVRNLGGATWKLLWAQIGFFAFGVVALFWSVLSGSQKS